MIHLLHVKSRLLGVGMTFIGAVYLAYMKIFDFRSRATRAEYWYFQLFLIGWLAFLWFLRTGDVAISLLPFLPILSVLTFTLVCLFVQTSLSVRRFHDLDKSGWWFLMQFIPYVGWLLIIFLQYRGARQALINLAIPLFMRCEHARKRAI